jgi:hypothetical protein
MKKLKRYILAGVGVVLVALGYLQTSKIEIQLNLHSGMLRTRRTAFGIQTWVSEPRLNALSQEAQREASGVEWLTVSIRSINRQPCREDYRTLISSVRNICELYGDNGEAKEFSRSVLDELNQNRSLSSTTRHVLRLQASIAHTGESLTDAWKNTTQDPKL